MTFYDRLIELQPCWIEQKCDWLISRIRKSRWAKDCFADAKAFIEEGQTTDVALARSWAYWGS